jgi:hypothetical protein
MSPVGAVQLLPRRPVAAPAAATAPVSQHGRLVFWYAAFAAFGAAVAITSRQPVQWTWGAWAAGGYTLAALAAARFRFRGRETALAIALTGALAAPLGWQVTFGRSMPKADESALRVVARSAVLLLHHGTPYLPSDQISRVLDYNPYEPAMTVFGLPAAAGLPGAAGNPRLWLGIAAAVVLAAAFRLAMPGIAIRGTVFAFSSPVLALPLTTGLTDVPVLALLCLALAGTTAGPRLRRAQLAAALAVGAACALKATAWPALPVLGALLAARDGSRAATRFAVTAGLTAAALVAATAPAAMTAPAALFQNTVLFPLGLTRYQTEAASPLPGRLLAETGPAGRWAAIGLLCAASLAIGASLVVRPPAGTRAAAYRLAAGLGAVFTLAPASRFGYFAYPAGLLAFATVLTPADRAEPGWGARARTTPPVSGLRSCLSRGAGCLPLGGIRLSGSPSSISRAWPDGLVSGSRMSQASHSSPSPGPIPGPGLPSPRWRPSGHGRPRQAPEACAGAASRRRRDVAQLSRLPPVAGRPGRAAGPRHLGRRRRRGA